MRTPEQVLQDMENSRNYSDRPTDPEAGAAIVQELTEAGYVIVPRQPFRISASEPFKWGSIQCSPGDWVFKVRLATDSPKDQTAGLMYGEPVLVAERVR